MTRILVYMILLTLSACIDVKTTASKHDNPPSVESPEIDQETGTGGRVGNGGGGILCRNDDGKIKSIEIFDFYESRAIDPTLNFEIPFQPQSSSSVDQAVETARHVVESRIRSFDEALADYLNWRLSQFKNQAILSDTPLPLTTDIEPMRAGGSNCRQIQLAFTRAPDLLHDKQFHIWKPAFEHPQFSLTNRAALILHELIYELTALRGAKTSQGARAMIAQIFSGRYLETFKSREEYFLFADSAELPWAGFGKLPVKLDAPKKFAFWDDGETLHSGYILVGDAVPTPIGTLRIGCDVRFTREGLPVFFSFIMGDQESNYPKFEIISVDGPFGSFSTYPSIMVANVKNPSVETWNISYKRQSCLSSSKYPVHQYAVQLSPDLNYQFFESINRPVDLKLDHAFFTMETRLSSNIRIEFGEISGRPMENALSHIKFKNSNSRESCPVAEITPSSIRVKDCQVKIFPIYERSDGLSIESINRNDLKYLTLQLSDESTAKDQWLIANDIPTRRKLLRKGSEASFDANGVLRRGQVLKAENICVSGSREIRSIDNPLGDTLQFDSNECLIPE